jgi:hypothetical protein
MGAMRQTRGPFSIAASSKGNLCKPCVALASERKDFPQKTVSSAWPKTSLGPSGSQAAWGRESLAIRE